MFLKHLYYLNNKKYFLSHFTHVNLLNPDVLTLDEDVQWVKLNTDMNGYYIVHYEADGWNALTEVLRVNHTALSFKDRANLIHNAFQLVT